MTAAEPTVTRAEPVAQATAQLTRGSRDRTVRLRRDIRLVLPPAIALGVVLVAWYAVSELLLDPRRRFLLPPPHEVLGVLGDPLATGRILAALATTALVALIGLAIATVVGFLTAVIMSQTQWLERSIYPWAVVLQTLPILAVVPLIGFWFGFELQSRVLVCVLIALFPIITNTLFGLKSVDRGHRDLFALHGATRRQRLLKLQLPGAAPHIFTGLRIAAGLSVIGAIVGDFFFRQGTPGIGRLIDQYTQKLQSAELFLAVIASSLLGLTVFWTFGLLGRYWTRSWVDSIHDDG